jgi:hypothetical protein
MYVSFCVMQKFILIDPEFFYEVGMTYMREWHMQ